MPAAPSGWAFGPHSVTLAPRISLIEPKAREVLVGEQKLDLQPHAVCELAPDCPLQIEELLAHSQSICDLGARISSIAVDAAHGASTPLVAVSVDCRHAQPHAFGSKQTGTGLIHIIAMDATRDAAKSSAVAAVAAQQATGRADAAAQPPSGKASKKRKRPKTADSSAKEAASEEKSAPSQPASADARAAGAGASAVQEPMGSATSIRYTLQHEGGYAEALQWCPSREVFNADEGDAGRGGGPRTGSNLLLAVLGNGQVPIWALPDRLDVPSTSASAQDPCPPEARITPKVELTSEELCGQRATCAAWSPHHPHENVLIGTHEGTVVAVRLAGALDAAAAPAATVYCSMQLCGASVRCLAWAPPHAFAESTAEENASLFVVGAAQGFLGVYDTRDPGHVALDLTTAPRSTINAVLWLRGDTHSVIVAASHSGVIRRISLEPHPAANTLASLAAPSLQGVLSLTYSDALKIVGYTTGGGDAVLVACIARMSMSFMYSPQATQWSKFAPRALAARFGVGGGGARTVATGADVELEALCEMARGQMDESGFEAKGKKAVGTADALRHPDAAVRAAAMADWRPDGGPVQTICACGSAGGLLVLTLLQYVAP